MVARLLLLMTLVTAPVVAQASGETPQWRVVADVPLPGKAARFDYQTFDSTTGLLWIAHMGAGEVLAFDVRSKKVVARVPNMRGVTGVRVVPALERLFAALSASHEVAVLGSSHGKVLARIPGGRFPDGLAYAAPVHKLYVSDEFGQQELVIDVPSGTARPPIQLGGEAGNTQYDSGTGLIWVAVQTRNELAAIDPRTDAVVERVPTPWVEHPHGFYVDSDHQVAYVTGETSGTVGVMSLRTKRMTRTYRVCDKPDVVAMDPRLGRLFVACESGVIAAFDARGDSLSVLPPYHAPHAHSVAVDPGTHLVYAPLENVAGKPVLRILQLH